MDQMAAQQKEVPELLHYDSANYLELEKALRQKGKGCLNLECYFLFSFLDGQLGSAPRVGSHRASFLHNCIFGYFSEEKLVACDAKFFLTSKLLMLTSTT